MERFGLDENEVWDLRNQRTLAPDDLEPSGPMLARRPDFAIWDSSVMYDSTVPGISPMAKVM